MNSAQALHSFWSGFGLTAYDENTVPDKAEFPYISYSVSESSLDYPVQLNASLWYRAASWEGITAMAEQISDHIGRGGVMIPTDKGAIWIKRGFTFAQRMTDDVDDTVRRMYLTVEVEFLS